MHQFLDWVSYTSILMFEFKINSLPLPHLEAPLNEKDRELYLNLVHKVEAERHLLENESERSDVKDVEGYIGTYWDLPEEMKDNEYIVRGYRIGYQGWWGGFKTIFMIHNETGSIWTHLLGKLFYLGVVVFVFFNFPSMSAYG